jgi:hypothetical protein
MAKVGSGEWKEAGREAGNDERVANSFLQNAGFIKIKTVLSCSNFLTI